MPPTAEQDAPTTEESIAAQDAIVSGFLGTDDAIPAAPDGDTPADSTATTPEETPPAADDTPAPQAAAEPPEWSRPVQKLQQDLANHGKKLEEILVALKANPTAANKAAAAEAQQQADALADIEKQLNDPDFDPYTASPKVLKALTGELRTIRAAQAKAAARDEEARQADTKKEAFWANWANENAELGRTAGEKLWQQAVAEIKADETFAPEDHLGAAKLLWQQKVKAEKAKKVATSPPPPKKPTPPITSSGGRMTPPGAREVKPSKAADPLGDYPDPTKFGLSDELL